MKTESSPWWRHLGSYIRQTLKGHPVACLSLGLTLVSATLTIGVFVQRLSAATPTADALEVGIALLQQGEARQAQPLFAAIDPSDSAYGMAKAYDALCRYEVCRADVTNGYRWFLDALKSPALQQAALPPELREDLAFKRVDALYQARQFGGVEMLPLITAFQQEHPASTRLAAMGEYEMAARFERGMQQTYGACVDETKRFQKTWKNGAEILEQFVSMAGKSPDSGYTALEDRSLAEDLQIALAVLGKEPAALTEIPVRDVVNRQRYGLMRVTLHQKLHPEEWEKNLQLAAQFETELRTYPVSRDRARTQRHLAAFGFRVGERLFAEIAGTPPNEADKAAAKRDVASRYFQAARATHRQLATEGWSRSRTSPTDMALLWVYAFNSYYCQRDFDSLMTVTTAQLTNSAPGTPNWLAAKVYQGITLFHQNTLRPGAAAAALDEVMSYGFKPSWKDATYDHLILTAARWRIQVALKTGDRAAAVKVVQWVEQGNAEPDLKEKFLRNQAWVTKWAESKDS